MERGSVDGERSNFGTKGWWRRMLGVERWRVGEEGEREEGGSGGEDEMGDKARKVWWGGMVGEGRRGGSAKRRVRRRGGKGLRREGD